MRALALLALLAVLPLSACFTSGDGGAPLEPDAEVLPPCPELDEAGMMDPGSEFCGPCIDPMGRADEIICAG